MSAMKEGIPPRIYCIPGTHAPVVTLFRRGPRNWSYTGRWDLAKRHFEPAAWLGGRIFPPRSDLSPDSRRFLYYLHTSPMPPGSTAKHTWLCQSSLDGLRFSYWLKTDGDLQLLNLRRTPLVAARSEKVQAWESRW
jgi:hypothetical protein